MGQWTATPPLARHQMLASKNGGLETEPAALCNSELTRTTEDLIQMVKPKMKRRTKHQDLKMPNLMNCVMWYREW